jgi:hypothetical protein
MQKYSLMNHLGVRPGNRFFTCLPYSTANLRRADILVRNNPRMQARCGSVDHIPANAGTETQSVF